MKTAKAPVRESPIRGELLTLPEAAERIRQSPKWIYAHIAADDLPFDYRRPPKGKLMFDSADLDDWLALGKLDCRSLKAQLDPNNVQEWFERTVAQLVDMKHFIEAYTGRKVRLRLKELEGN